MSLDSQISSIIRKSRFGFRNLRRSGSESFKELKLQMVHKCVLSHNDHCNAILGAISEHELLDLLKIHKRTVWFIYGFKGKDRRRPIAPPFLQELHLSPLVSSFFWRGAGLWGACKRIATKKLCLPLVTSRRGSSRGESRRERPYVSWKEDG